jgi:hypothetical protein
MLDCPGQISTQKLNREDYGVDKYSVLVAVVLQL